NPNVSAIGSFDRSNDRFTASDKVFNYNAGEYIGIQGTGLGIGTRVRINGKEVSNLLVESASLISLPVPDNTIGQLIVEVSNTDFGEDTVTDTSLEIRYDAKIRISAAERAVRVNQLLATADANEVRLYSTRDGVIPLLLSKVAASDDVALMAMNASRIGVVSQGSGDIEVFDITNIYNPAPLNRINNVQGYDFSDLVLTDASMVLLAGNSVLYGNPSSADLSELALDGSALGQVKGLVAVADSLVIYFERGIEVRDAAEPSRLLNSWQVADESITSVAASDRWLTVSTNNGLHLLDKRRLTGNAGDALVGSIPWQELSSATLSISGDLLIAVNGATWQIYDLDIDGYQALSVRPVARIAVPSGGLNGIGSISLNNGLLEWVSQKGYLNVAIDLAQGTELLPAQLAAEKDELRLDITGDALAWSGVELAATSNSDAATVSGVTIQEGAQLRFEIGLDSYAPGESYSIDFVTQPTSVVTGGDLNLDLPITSIAAPIFGITPMTLQSVSPITVVAGTAVEFTVYGQQLQLVETLSVGSVELARDQLTVNAEGTRLNFTATLTESGLQSIIVQQVGQQAVLPAAVAVRSAMGISNVASDNSAGATRVSDAGGDQITLTTSGISSDVTLHWYQTGQGIQPNASNEIRYSLAGDQLTFVAPASLVGAQYDIALWRRNTGEVTVTGADQRMLVIDDTRPTVNIAQQLGYSLDLVLQANEPIKAAGTNAFSVVKVFKDYDSHPAPQIDISDRFEPLRETGGTITLSLKDSSSLEHNAEYLVTISGLQDLSGNQAYDNSKAGISGGVLSTRFVAEDLLAPDAAQLKLRYLDGSEANASDVLKRGTQLYFNIVGVDNYKAAEQISYRYRISDDGGLSYRTGWLSPGKDTKVSNLPYVPVQLDADFSSLSILLEASDGKQKVEKRFDFAVTDPELSVQAFSTNPSTVEEQTRVMLQFQLSGDLSLVDTAQIKVFDDGSWQTVSLDKDTGLAALSYLNPKLIDVLGSGSEVVATTVPVSLRVGYGFSGQLSYRNYVESYVLNPDSTPPSLAIVAPQDGEYVPRGQETEVILRAFDSYGISHVDVCRDSLTADPFADAVNCQQLADPSVYPMLVAEDAVDPIVVNARAVDLNGLVSDTVTATYQPIDPEQAAPKLDILNIENGLVVHSGEALSVQVLMRDITSAQLNFDLNADETNAQNPAAIALVRGESDRVEAGVEIPDVTQSAVLVVRVEAVVDGVELKSQRYLNVVVDNGIEESIAVDVLPAAEVLAGTAIRVSGAIPEGMD
ncbi:MAG: Ig-like domain-containing protein, partial [Ketobacter sp.]